jgi:hypothetical protein
MPLGDPLPGRDPAAFVTGVESASVRAAADALALTWVFVLMVYSFVVGR